MSLQLGRGGGVGPLGLGGLTTLGAIRTAIGVSMLASPSLLPRLLGADRVTADRVSWLTRMVGVREIVIGVGTAAGGRRWAAAGIVADTADALTFAAAVRSRHVNRVFGAGSAVAAVAGIAMGVAGLADRRRTPEGTVSADA